MKFHIAQVADIIRSSQRDENFISELQDYLTSVVKYFGQKNHNRIRRILPHITTTWYYLLTSVSNLQTLGEEYTGTIRLDRRDNIPPKHLQLIWLILYIGGESLLERIINQWQDKISKSTELRNEVKNKIITAMKFLRRNKNLFLQLHHSIFYINGTYYNISNRLTGLKYVLVREWLQNDAASKSFKLLGWVTFLYVIVNIVQNYRLENVVNENISYSSDNGKLCILCVENRKNTCSTLCGHLFCWECIYDCLKYQQNCPVCREIIKPNRIIFLQNYE